MRIQLNVFTKVHGVETRDVEAAGQKVQQDPEYESLHAG